MVTLSTTEDIPRLAVITVKEIEVQKIITATTAVNLLRKLKAVGPAKRLSAPPALPPKMPAADPFPLCISTDKIKSIHAVK
jgi:hypothetical protein